VPPYTAPASTTPRSTTPTRRAVGKAPAPASTTGATSKDPVRTALEVVQTVFQTWAEGGYLAEGTGDAAIARDCAANVSIQANAHNYKWTNTVGYKHYSGLGGMKEWLVFLTTVDFPDFKVVSMEPVSDSEVAATVAYTPTVKATAKTAAAVIKDTQTWTVREGKVTEVVFHWCVHDSGINRLPARCHARTHSTLPDLYANCASRCYLRWLRGIDLTLPLAGEALR
jgi:hypothetical protein